LARPPVKCSRAGANLTTNQSANFKSRRRPKKIAGGFQRTVGGFVVPQARQLVSFLFKKGSSGVSVIATKEKYSLNPPSFVTTPKQIC